MDSEIKLAIDGGWPIRTTPFPAWPYFAPDEIEAVQKILVSGKVNYWTGNEGKYFEKEFADFVGAKHAIALTNGTVALELALYVLDIAQGDEVIVPSKTFIASASCVVMRGAIPVIADIDPVSQNLTVETIRAVLTPKTKAIIAVHLAGWPCDMDAIMAFAKEHNLYVIEDCAQAHGALYKERMVGSMGDLAAFSFCQDKIMTTGGEGGMLVTNNQDWWQKAWAFKDHGKNYDTVHSHTHAPGFRWLHESFGTNWRLTEIQSAIGRLQLRKLPEWLEKRRTHADILNQQLQNIRGLRLSVPPQDISHAYYKYYAFIESSELLPGWNQDRLMMALHAEGIPCMAGSCSEIYREKAFNAAGLELETKLLTASKLSKESLVFLVHPTLSKEDMEDVSRAIKKVFLFATTH